MADLNNKKSSRPWRAIAEEVSRELDPDKLTRLLEELNQAMEEQINGNHGRNGEKGQGTSAA